MSNASRIESVAAIYANDIQTAGVDEVDRRLAETCDNEEIMNIITELDGTKRQLNVERLRVSELEDQLSSLSKIIKPFGFISFYLHLINIMIASCLVQDNRELQNRVAQSVTSDLSEMRSMHDELAILEESG